MMAAISRAVFVLPTMLALTGAAVALNLLPVALWRRHRHSCPAGSDDKLCILSVASALNVALAVAGWILSSWVAHGDYHYASSVAVAAFTGTSLIASVLAGIAFSVFAHTRVSQWRRQWWRGVIIGAVAVLVLPNVVAILFVAAVIFAALIQLVVLLINEIIFTLSLLFLVAVAMLSFVVVIVATSKRIAP